MKLDTKKWLDYYAGGLLMTLLKPTAWVIGRFLQRNHDLTPKGEIVFIKMLGAGSLIIALPALLGIRRQYPEIKLTLVTTNAVENFAESLGVFNRTLLVDESSLTRLIYSSLNILVQLFRVDTVVDLEVYSRLSSVFATLTCARNRIGFYLEAAFWRKNLHTHLIFFNRFSGVYHFYNAVATRLGSQAATVGECQQHLRAITGEIEETRKVSRRIAIGHACSDLGRERMLSLEQWGMVFSQQLEPAESAEIVLFGAASDRPMAEEIISSIAPRFPNIQWVNQCGQLSQKEAVRALASCDEFWGIDSVLLHFARLLCRRCISFWGPTDPQTRLIPVEKLEEEVCYRKLPCSPCIHVAESPPCMGNNLCIQGLFQNDSAREPPSWMV